MAEINVALNKITTASSYVKPYESCRAVNGTYSSGTPTSRWLCNTLPGWMYVDLGVNYTKVYWINRWVVRHMPTAGWRSPDYCITDFKLQGSDDTVHWTDLDIVTGNTSPITDRTLVNAVFYRYIRLYVTKGLKCNNKMASIMELEIYQSPPLSAYLKTGTGLTVSSGALNPAFVNNVFNYTTPNVANNVTAVTVQPIAEDPNALLRVNGTAVVSGGSTNVPLNVGSNAIPVIVRGADGRSTNTYTVTVIRNEPPVAYLTGLSLSTTASPSVAVPYTPSPFNKDTLAYSASVGYDVNQLVVTPTTDIQGAVITVNGSPLVGGAATVNLAVGSNTISVVVTNSTATMTYTITVTRSAALTGISAAAVVGTTNTPIVLTPSTFSKDTLLYTGTIECSDPNFNIQNLAITPTANADTVIKYLGNPTPSGTPVMVNNPAVGDTSVVLVASASDGTGSVTYTVTITRKHSTLLSGIIATPAVANPTVTKAILTYTIKTGAISATITLTPEDTTASIKAQISSVWYDLTSGVPSPTITVSSGPNGTTVPVTVSSTNGIPDSNYIIKLKR